jgi:hypothetical protein
MILFVNPRATRPTNRRFPLSVMAIAAALPAGESWHIIDENLPNADPLAELMELIAYFYTPTPQRRGTCGDVDALQGTPTSLEEWTEPAWDTQAYGHLRQAAPAVP